MSLLYTEHLKKHYEHEIVTVLHRTPKDHPSQIWFNLGQRLQRKISKYDLLSKYA